MSDIPVHKPIFDRRLFKDSYTFIIRIWCEAVDDEGNVATWRGSIDHVGRDQRFYFKDLEGISDFIQEQISLKREQNQAWWKTIWLKLHNGYKGK